MIRLENKKRLKIEEVAVLLGCSTKTIENWYAFKRKKPNNKYAMLLPEYQQEGARQTRYWLQEDIPSLKEFKRTLPKGRGGVLGCITQRYCGKKGD